ncbi:MAG: exodeoxyribonuclease VII small subunit [Clostridiales bacterium]|nr:exodeoxyribonuclease VII small subunit [Clostridiales bacterium]
MNKKMSFEEADAKLEAIIKKMENDNLTLQDSMEEYAKACELLAYCMNELEACRGKIEDINERIEKLKIEGNVADND